MAYRPHDRNPSGIMFFGTSTGDPVYDSSPNFTIGGGVLHSSNLTVNDGGYVGSVTTQDAITIAANGDIALKTDLVVGIDLSVAGDIAAQGDVVVDGDLTVHGTTTTVNSTTITVEDPIIVLGSGTPTADDNKDRGVSFNYYDTTAKTGFFGFDDSTGRFTFVPDATISSETVSGSTGMIEANFMGDIYAGNGTSKILENGTSGSDAVFTGDVVGNADTASKWENSIDITLTGEVTTDSAVALDGSSNISLAVSLDTTAITGQTEYSGAHDGSTDDYILLYDDSASALKKINRTNFVSGLGAMSSFTISDTNNTQIISDGETLEFDAGSGINITVNQSANEIDFGLDHNEINHDLLLNFVANEHINHGNIQIQGGAGMVGGGAITGSHTLDVIGGDGITVNADEVEVTVDDTTVELSNTNGTGAVRVKNGGITETQRHRSVETVTSNKDPVDHDVTLVNAVFGNITVKLPENGDEGRMFIVKRVDSSSNTVTIERKGSDTIDGSNSYQLFHIYESLKFCSDGSNWYII
tara:strand:+ start:23177 stop:24760 length:1584 start_codon:yes stop_codon:yes gene_type:complete